MPWGEDRDHVVPYRHIRDSEKSAINASGPRDLPHLLLIDGRDNRNENFRTPRFDLDKTQCPVFERNDVDLTGNGRPGTIAANRNFEIRHDDTIAVGAQIPHGQCLTLKTEREIFSLCAQFLTADDRILSLESRFLVNTVNIAKCDAYLFDSRVGSDGLDYRGHRILAR